MKLNKYFLICLLFLGDISWSQTNKESFWKDHFDFKGYVKYMPSVFLIHTPQVVSLQNNLFHNRLELSSFISEVVTVKLDVRNRFFFGEYVKSFPNFGQFIKQSNRSANGYDDYLSWLVLDSEQAVIHSTIDRFYVHFSKGKWDITLGRQRINWGINTIWNPNDIFNTYSFTDFDYEERPGSDALRVQYATGPTGSIEFAARLFTDIDYISMGSIWRFNKWNTDFQVISGVLHQDIVLGLGWSTYFGNNGCKGEMSYFINYTDTANSRHQFVGTLSWDYMLDNNGLVSVGFLYNHLGVTSLSSSSIFAIQPTARMLYPYRYTLLVGYMQPIKEIISLSINALYSPGESHSLFVSPSFQYLINENWDISFVSQIALGMENNEFKSPLQVFFLRFKLSF